MEGHGFAQSSPQMDAEYYKRAVIKAAPSCFTVEVLPPIKQGKAHIYGVRIIPLNALKLQQQPDPDHDDTQSITSDSTVSSIGREYEIWRRWDDVLDFETKLEEEYSRMSREKKRGLRQKKGSGDRNGTLYSNPNAAASFESLPEGPDPKNIKVDLHAYIPRITRKSSFFSVSDATVQKRGEEFAAMIYGLFKADCPKLIEELRDSSVGRDFFAWWRRDQELMEKRPKRPSSGAGKVPAPLASIRSPSRASVGGASSVFVSPPSPDSPGFSMKKRNDKEYVHQQRSPTETTSPTNATPTINTPTINTSSPHLRGDKSLPSPPTSPEQSGSIGRSRSPMPFRAGRPNISRPMVHPHFNSDGTSLLSPPSEGRRARSPATQNRMGRVFDIPDVQSYSAAGPSDTSSDSSASPPITPTRQTRPSTVRPVSQCSVNSIDSADYDIDLSFIQLEAASRKRDSMASVRSVDSVRTTSSMEGVLGTRALHRSSRMSGSRSRPRRNGTWEPDLRLSYAVPEEDEAQFADARFILADGGDRDDFRDELESAFDDSMSYLGHLDSFPEVPSSEEGVQDEQSYRGRRMSFPASVCESSFDGDFDMYSEPPSPTSTIQGPASSDSGHSMMTVTSTLEPGMCAIKAKYDDIIVALRLPIGTPLSTLRARLSEKLAQVEGIRLHYRFCLAYAPPRRQGSMLGDADAMPIMLSPAAFGNIQQGPAGRPHSVASTIFGAAQLTRLVPIWSQDDWELALNSCNNKIVLHVIEQEVR